MMFLQGQQSQEVSEFTGPQQTVRIDNLGPTQAVEAINCDYGPKGVGCRRGFELPVPTISSSGIITSFFNWLGASFNRLLYTNPTSIRTTNIDTGVDTLLYTLGSGVPLFASYEAVGNSVYVAMLKSVPVGTGFQLAGLETIIVSQDPIAPASVTADPIWQAAPSAALFTALTPTLFGAGSSTAGIHHVAIVVTTRSGQVCPPIPVGSVTFDQNKSYTVAITVGGAIGAQYYRMQFAITEAGAGVNGRYYIIPDVLNSFLLVGGGTKTLGIGMSDTTLISTGTDTTPFFQNFYQGQLIQGAAVTLQPTFVKAYETRLAFCVLLPASNVPGTQFESALLFSDAGLPQSVALDRSIVQLPGAKPITAAATLRGAFYVFGPTYTYVLYSSVDDPVTWATAQLIDGQVGAPTPFCVCESISKGVIWVANPQGLWALIGGQYQQKPISWYCEDWDYIDWSVQSYLQLVDDTTNQTVTFTAKMNGHPVVGLGTAVFAFNYEKGIDSDSVRYSLNSPWDTFQDPATSSFIRLGQSVDANRKQRLVKTHQSIFYYQFLDSTLNRYTDVTVAGASGVPIKSSYTHAPLPTDNSNPIKLNGIQLRLATQNGVVNPSVLARDGSRPTALAPIVTSSGAVTDDTTTRLFDKQSNGMQFKINAVGGWFLDWMQVFWTAFAWNK